MKRIHLTAIFCIVLIMQSCRHNSGHEVNFFPDKQYLKEWKLRSSLQTASGGKDISSVDFNDSHWLDAEVPTTVLRALVKAKVYPDPHYDLNNFLIPDASDDLNKRLDLGKYSHIKGHPNPFKDPYWFRTVFNIPEGKKGKKVWLHFKGINYRADVWLNGIKIAGAENMAGMFRRFTYDITGQINFDGLNTLAVKIHQVDHPGDTNPGKQLEVFGPNRGHGEAIFKDVTLKLSAGWDCAPVVRDRNMGIYQDVFLTYTGDVQITDPHVVTDLPLPDTTVARLTLTTDLTNTGDGPQKGILKGDIVLMKEIDFFSYTRKMAGEMKTIHFEKEIEVPAGKTIKVRLSPQDFPQLAIENPHLWWPNGYGLQYLHKLSLSYEVKGKISDGQEITFGIREITNKLKEIDGEFGRTFYVNGQRIFARGGWIQPDMMLDMNEKRSYNEVRLLTGANINMIANEDMPAPPDYLMDIYDKYGLLVWETFYQCWRMYPGTESFLNPVDTDLALKNSFDIVRRYRNHPSLLLWAVACEVTVREEIYVPLRTYIKEMDITRPFLPTSSYGWDVDQLTPFMKQDLPLGVTDEGPPDYTWYPHEYYYDMVLKVRQQMFRDEMGVPSVPVLSSMKKFIYDLGKGPKNELYPLDKNWAHHGAWDLNGYAFRAYDKALRDRYGEPESAADYTRKAQYVNAGSYRAMFEAANHRMWDITQGVMIWKLNSTWPTVLWQIYDWFLNPNAAYYFTKKALEPIHIQLNENDFTVSVINTKHAPQNDLTVSAKVFDLELNTLWEKEEKINIAEDRYAEVFSLPVMKNPPDIFLVKLILKNKRKQTISDNFYWFSSKKKTDFRQLARLEKVIPDISSGYSEEGKEFIMKVTVKNNSDKLSFFNRLMITKGKGGEEILPTFWSDNFITLLPGEEKMLTARFAVEELDGKNPVVVSDPN